jgi:hypothetical protein
MGTVSVKVMTTPRLLADLIAAALDSTELSRWAPGDDPALVTITNTDQANIDSRVTIVLGDRLDDPVGLIIDGVRSSAASTRPQELQALVLETVRALVPRARADIDGAANAR